MKTHFRNGLIAILVLAASGTAAFGQAGPDPAAAQAGAVVKGVSFVVSETTLDVTIAIEGECLSQPQVLTNPSRLVVDIAPAVKMGAKAITEVNAFGMTNIRTGMFQPQIARVIFDFSGEIPSYEIRKTAGGILVKFTKPGEPAAKAAVPPAQDKPAPRIARPAVQEKAQDAAAEESWPAGFYNMSFAVFGGSYTSPSQDFKDVYGAESSLQYGVNLTRTLLRAKGFQIDATFELRTFSKTGKSTLSGEEAKFSLTPITIGGRFLYQTKYVMPFIGFGADFYNYDETSPLANTSGSANGGHIQAGLYVIFPKVEFLRLKAYYKYTKVTATAEGFDVGLGGPEYGFGLAFGFNVLKKAMLMF